MGSKHIGFNLLNILCAEIFIILLLILYTNCAEHSVPNFSSDTYVADTALDVAPDTYEEDCYRTHYWFCPPLNAVWQMPVLMDVCTDPPTVIDIGECIEFMECDPSIFEQGSQECVNEDGYPGTQKIFCNKGNYQYGDCVTPCEEEICDGKDNDCDGDIDEGQLNACGNCGVTSSEVCDGIDNNCNGITDEELVQECATTCGIGVEFCVEGSWVSCTATQSDIEICNNIDDNCNGQIDEGLKCSCTADLVGVLIPCFEDPLVCGQGFKSCECADNICEEFVITPCQAACAYYPGLDPNCDPTIGVELAFEVCNNFDDNCNQQIDEDLISACYTGPEGTVNMGICLPGENVCEAGVWGGYKEGTFQAGFCEGETLPEGQDNCNGTDEDCDGLVDSGKELQDTDILFIVDWSGSMGEEIDAVTQALSMFAANYSDQEIIQWGLIIGPVKTGINKETLRIQNDLTNFQTFITSLTTNLPELGGAKEMLFDAIYLSLHAITSNAGTTPLFAISWSLYTNSIPGINDFKVNWRKDSKKVIIIFTDELGQSYLSPQTSQEDVIDSIKGTQDLKVYTFTNELSKENNGGWEPVAVSSGGKWFELLSDPILMYASLLEILDDNICE